MLKKRLSPILVLLMVFALLIFIKTADFQLLNIHMSGRPVLNRIPFLVIISAVISFLLIRILDRRKDFWTLLNFLGIFAIIFVANWYVTDYYAYENFDYCLSKRVENYSRQTFTDRAGWHNDRFVVGKDTVVYGQNPSFGKIYKGNFRLYKSRFHRYYYLHEDSQQ